MRYEAGGFHKYYLIENLFMRLLFLFYKEENRLRKVPAPPQGWCSNSGLTVVLPFLSVCVNTSKHVSRIIRANIS